MDGPTIQIAPDRRLDGRRGVALVAPLVLMAVTWPVFSAASAVFGDAAGGELAWFVGMAFYWVVWGGAFSWWILGGDRVRRLIRPQRFSWEMAGHVAFLVVMAAAVRYLVPGMAYEKTTVAAAVLLWISPFFNGVFEELLWRGVYLDLFRHQFWPRVVWASAWFGLWHLVPGSISAEGAHPAMVIGPVFMGLYFAHLARKSDSVWWPILAHTLGGLVMVS